jgi:hypothetical protein
VLLYRDGEQQPDTSALHIEATAFKWLNYWSIGKTGGEGDFKAYTIDRPNRQRLRSPIRSKSGTPAISQELTLTFDEEQQR